MESEFVRSQIEEIRASQVVIKETATIRATAFFFACFNPKAN